MAFPVLLIGLLGYRKGISGIKSVWLCHIVCCTVSAREQSCTCCDIPLWRWKAEIHTVPVPEDTHMVVCFWTVFWALINGIACSRVYPAQTEYKWLLSVFAWSSQGQMCLLSSVLRIEMVTCFPQFCLKILHKCIEVITLFCQSSPASFSYHTVPCHPSELLPVFLAR